MRLWPKSWHAETWVCSMRGHVIPAGTVERLRPEDRELGIDTPDGRRLARCLRGDVWVEGTPRAPGAATATVHPAVDQIPKPRRGNVLADAILLRLIALNRAVHSVLFGTLAITLVVLETQL